RRRIFHPFPSPSPPTLSVFFCNDPATTEIYTLSLHDALPISVGVFTNGAMPTVPADTFVTQYPFKLGVQLNSGDRFQVTLTYSRSEEHTSELQSLTNLVCRLLLEKKKKTNATLIHTLIQRR